MTEIPTEPDAQTIHEKACPDAEDHSEHEWGDAYGDTFYCPGEWL